jgi:hypothetical protein
MREITFPSRLPGVAFIAAFAAVLLLGLHISFTAFAHYALGHDGPFISHLGAGESTLVVKVLVKCSATALNPFQYISGATTQSRVCRVWWTVFDAWSRGPGAYYFGVTIVGAFIAGYYAYSSLHSRHVPGGRMRRRTASYATEYHLRPFSRIRNPEREGALPLGRTEPEEELRKRIRVWLPYEHRFQHAWILGTTGTGKTSAVIKQWLAADAPLDGVASPKMMSTVAIDVKDPDLWEFAAPICMQYNRRVLRWAPMSEHTMRHNFLDYVRSAGDAIQMAETILSNDPEAHRKDPFWRGLERNLLSLTIQMVCEEPPERFKVPSLDEKMEHVLGTVPPSRSLAFVFGLSHLHPSEFVKLVEHVDGDRTVWRDRFATVFAADREKAIGAWLGLQNILVIFRNRAVIESTSESDFNLAVLCHQPTTLIIGLPRHPGSQRQVLTALFIRQLLDRFAEIGQVYGRLPVPVTMLLDELGVLGHIPNFADYVATYRDIGVSFMIATQDRAQLVDLYGEEKANTLIANLHTRIVFGRDLRPEQAEEICRALGEIRITEPSAGYQHRGMLGVSRASTHIGYTYRRLIEPNELRSLPEFHAIVVLPGDVKAHVYLPPVHLDKRYRKVLRSVTLREVILHNIRMAKELGRFPPPGWTPAKSAPPQPPPQPPAPQVPTAPAPTPQPAPQPPVAPPPATDEAPPGPTTDSHPPATADEEVPAPAEAAPTARQPESTVSQDGDLASLVAGALSGKLSDPRMPKGGPPGWVYADRRGEFLIPWGYFRDWAMKSGVKFVEVEERWKQEGLVRGRASVNTAGRHITCLAFTKKAALALPEGMREAIASRFAKISPSAVRETTSAKVEGWGPDVDAPGNAPAYLKEFINACQAEGRHFIGHPARDENSEVYGRWVAKSKEGDDLLLVERSAAEKLFEKIGINDPLLMLTAWKNAGLLYLTPTVRKEFYIRRTHGEGKEFLALRWDKLRKLLPEATLGVSG